MACDLAQARLKKGWGKLMARPGAWGKVLEKVLVVSGHVPGQGLCMFLGGLIVYAGFGHRFFKVPGRVCAWSLARVRQSYKNGPGKILSRVWARQGPEQNLGKVLGSA